MLSDEQMDREIREHVEKHPVILPEDYQTMVQNQIKKCCEGEMSMSQNKQRKKKMIAAACMILCIGVCGAGGVRAGMNYAKQRVEKTSEKEQDYSRMEVFCRFRINQRLYLIKSVSWLRPVLFICRRKH